MKDFALMFSLKGLEMIVSEYGSSYYLKVGDDIFFEEDSKKSLMEQESFPKKSQSKRFHSENASFLDSFQEFFQKEKENKNVSNQDVDETMSRVTLLINNSVYAQET